MSTMLMNYEPRVRSSVHWLLGAPAWLQNFKKYLNAIFKELARKLTFLLISHYKEYKKIKHSLYLKNGKIFFDGWAWMQCEIFLIQMQDEKYHFLEHCC